VWERDKSDGTACKVTFRVIRPDASPVAAIAASGADGSATATLPKSFGLCGLMPHGTYRLEKLAEGHIVATEDFSM